MPTLSKHVPPAIRRRVRRPMQHLGLIAGPTPDCLRFRLEGHEAVVDIREIRPGWRPEAVVFKNRGMLMEPEFAFVPSPDAGFVTARIDLDDLVRQLAEFEATLIGDAEPVDEANPADETMAAANRGGPRCPTRQRRTFSPLRTICSSRTVRIPIRDRQSSRD